MQNFNLICLIETRVRAFNADGVRMSTFLGWNFVDNYEFHEFGRIWIGWKGSAVSIRIVQKSDHIISSCKSLVLWSGLCLLFMESTVGLLGEAF